MKSKIYAAAFIAAWLSAGQLASAAIDLYFGTEFSDSGSSLSGTVKVTIDDGGGSGSVDVTIDTTGLDGSLTEYIAGLYLNVDPQIDPATLSVAFDAVSPPQPTSVNLGTDGFQADGDGLYDIEINYPSAGASRFLAGMTDTITFTLTGLVEDDFDFLSSPAGGKGPYVAALRARSLDADGDGSGWFYPSRVPPGGDIPEPASVVVWSLMMSLGLGVFVYRRLR